jgi:hypothetical protein
MREECADNISHTVQMVASTYASMVRYHEFTRRMEQFLGIETLRHRAWLRAVWRSDTVASVHREFLGPSEFDFLTIRISSN